MVLPPCLRGVDQLRLLNELRQRTDDLTRSLDDLRTAQDRLVQTEKLAVRDATSKDRCYGLQKCEPVGPSQGRPFLSCRAAIPTRWSKLLT
jgi:hypothetical protein